MGVFSVTEQLEYRYLKVKYIHYETIFSIQRIIKSVFPRIQGIHSLGTFVFTGFISKIAACSSEYIFHRKHYHC